jgi:phosphoglycolate phosphatase
MARLAVGGLVRDIDVVVLDKDGTLIDFDKAWGGRLARGIAAVTHAATGGRANAVISGQAHATRGGQALSDALYRTLGGDAANGAIMPDGPYVSASIADTGVMAATVLYQAGVDWHGALAIVEQALLPILRAPPEPSEIAGVGDVRAKLSALKAAGLGIAVATNDERLATLGCLDLLGITGLLDGIVCAGDAGLAAKPAPDGLLHIARTLGVPVRRLAMVGDSIGDMLTGRAAGVGLTVGVLSGPATAAQLRPHADALAADIHALSVVDRQARSSAP